ncbi:hypothetical protein F5I97DRAFT_1932583 [Phlebopus sp. FC_14]|nr:hypothetical protein F5I97DRAFT_1932583 [Phlebopus sp. FC_14]
MIPLQLVTHLAPVGWALLLDTLLRFIVNKHAIMTMINYAQRPSIAYQPHLLLSPGRPHALNHHPTCNDDGGDHRTGTGTGMPCDSSTMTSTSRLTPRPTSFPLSFDLVSHDSHPTSGIEGDMDIPIRFVDESSSLESDVSDTYSFTIPNVNREDVTVPDPHWVNEKERGGADDDDNEVRTSTKSL